MSDLLNPNYLLSEKASAEVLSDLLYLAEPHEYFAWRFSLLALAGDKTKDLDRLLREGISFAGFEVGPLPQEGEPPEAESLATAQRAEDDEREAHRRYRFAVAEAAALLHHVSETVLRLYFAHCELSRVPWLEIARERNHQRFKKRVRARFVDAETDEDGYRKIAQVFWGTYDHADLSPSIAEERFLGGVENIDKWMRFFARTFLDDAHLYNALKHGLAVNAGDSALKVGDGSIFNVDGPSLAYLDARENEGRRVWSITTRWIDLGQAMGAIFVGIKLIETLWTVSQVRYTGMPEGPIGVFTGLPFDEFQKARTPASASDTGVVITSMSWNLRYFESEEAAAAAGERQG